LHEELKVILLVRRSHHRNRHHHDWGRLNSRLSFEYWVGSPVLQIGKTFPTIVTVFSKLRQKLSWKNALNLLRRYRSIFSLILIIKHQFKLVWVVKFVLASFKSKTNTRFFCFTVSRTSYIIVKRRLTRECLKSKIANTSSVGIRTKRTWPARQTRARSFWSYRFDRILKVL